MPEYETSHRPLVHFSWVFFGAIADMKNLQYDPLLSSQSSKIMYLAVDYPMVDYPIR